MFLMSASLARPRLDEVFPVTTQVSSVNPQKLSNELSVDSSLASKHLLLIGLTASPSQCWCALERGHVELLQHAFHVRSINAEVVPFLRSHQGSAQVACWLCRHLVALEVPISAPLSEDFCDGLVRSSQQQVVQKECECNLFRCASTQARVQHDRDEATLPEKFLQMVLAATRRASHTIQTFFCSFQITVPLLGSSVSSCHSGGGLAYTTSPSHCATVFTSATRCNRRS